jgi:aminomethyltransferase
MGEFAGFEMPLFYPLGVMKEHLHTRAHAGLFDISHMVHIEIRGSGATDFIGHLCPFEPHVQTIGQAKYTYFLNDQAGIIDDLIITRLADDRFLIVANAGCAEKDVAHVQAHAAKFDVEVFIIPRGFIALQGPDAEDVLQQQFDVSTMPFMSGVEPREGWFLSRTGYTGEDGFEIAIPETDCASFAKSLANDDRVEWIGLGARDSLRLEAGLPLYGQDLSEDITPSEAGLLWAIPKDIRSDGGFIGAESLASLIAQGRKRMRIGLLPDGRPVRGGTALVSEDGAPIGVVTSGGFGPTIGAPMAMALVNTDAADQPIFADMRGKKIPMNRVKTPFAPHNYKR